MPRRTEAPEAVRLDVDLLRRAAVNLDTVAQELYDRFEVRYGSTQQDRRLYERYAKLSVLAAGIRRAIEERYV